MSDSERVQTVRNAWINALRAEILRTDIPELPRIATIGMWIATYADADGGNAFPARETLAELAGASVETVTRAVKVLMAVGLMERKRRPNRPAVYQLLIPMARPDWAAHVHLYTDNRQRRHRAEKKKRDLEQPRTASPDTVRTASPPGVPDSVPAGRSGQRPRTPSTGPDSVPGRPRTASPDTVRTASPPGGYQYLPTSGRDPYPDHDMAGLSPQPQVDGPARGESELSPEDEQPSLRPIQGGGHGAGGDRQPSLLIGPVPDLPPAPRGPRPRATVQPGELRAAADYREVLATVDADGEQAAIARYGGRLVTGALATRRTGT